MDSADPGGVHDDVVEIAAVSLVELASAGDEAQLRIRSVAVDRFGREVVLVVPLDPLGGEHGGRAVRSVNEDRVSASHVSEATEDRGPEGGVEVSGDHRGAAFAGFRAVAPPSGALERVRSGQDAVLVDRQGLDG